MDFEYIGQHLVDQYIELMPPVRIHRFIEGTVLERCNVVVRCGGSSWIIGESTWIACNIIAIREQKAKWWLRANVRGCNFRGRFIDTAFGRNPNAEAWPQTAGIADSDFSQATLHMCSFDNCDISTMKWPKWPNFIVPNPAKMRTRFKENYWQGSPRLRVWAQAIVESPSFTSAVADNAEMLLKDDPLPLEEFRAVLERIGGIVID